MCEKEITKKEIDAVVKELKRGSSPGIDGLSYEFYIEYWDVIGEEFTKMIIEVSETECTISQYLGIIILLYKNGIRENLGNWRPITLLNCDYKILEKVLANRLKNVISKLIKEDQKAYIKDRYIGDNARLMEDLIFECETNNIDGAMILIDQSKAYDRVEWKWLEKVLQQFNFGPKFINWIVMLYAHAKSTIMTNGHFSETISLKRGLRQGSPLSSLLYILQAEPFAETIRKSTELKGITVCKKEIKITAFADDTQIYISNEKAKKEMDKILNLYSQASGARINEQKTEGILLGNMKEIEGIRWTCGPVKALGVPQGLIEDLSQFWDKILQKVRKRLQMWQKRNLTIQGKVHIIKSMALSTVTYAAGLKIIPEKSIREINKEIWKYLWDGKNESVSREICMNKRSEGGIGMPNIIDTIRTRHVMMIKRILTEGEQTWKTLPRKYFKSLDDEYNEEYFLLKASVPHNIIDKLKIPEFYKECIKSWQQVLSKEEPMWTKENITKQRLWFNPHLKVDGKMLNNKIMATSGIHTVKDVITDNGKIRHLEIKHKMREVDVTLYLNKIMAAMPTIWKTVLITEENNETNIKQTKEKQTQVTLLTIEACTSKTVYNVLNRKKAKTRWEAEWEAQYGEQEWVRIYKGASNKLVERKCIDLHWKSLTYGLNTEEKLKKMKLSNGKCSLCTIEIENTEHLFFGCELISSIWAFFSTTCQQIWNIALNEEIILLLCDKKNPEKYPRTVYGVIVFIVISVKWILWKRRNLTKYDNKWNSELETEQWAKQYIIKRIEVLMTAKIKKEIKIELEKLLQFLIQQNN